MVGRLLLRLLPWWVFALMALSFAPISYGMVQDTRADRAEAAAARASAPLPATPIAEFHTQRVTTLLNEVHLTARATAAPPVWERAQKGIDFAFVVIADGPATNQRRPYVLLYVPAYLADLTVERLAADRTPDGRQPVRGFATGRGIRPPPQSWLDTAVPGGHYRGIILPYFGDRAAGIDGAAQDSIMVSAIAVGMNLILAGIALVKFIQWRRRRTRRPARRKPPARADPFADGPIQSARKGWFGS